jgi:hypothetical protein
MKGEVKFAAAAEDMGVILEEATGIRLDGGAG